MFFYPVHVFFRNVTLYEYFVFDNGEVIIYATIEWFTYVHCNFPVLKILNKFNKTSLNWIKELNYTDKFTDFQGCELVLMAPVDSNRWNKAIVNNDSSEFEIIGIAPIVFQEMSKRYNFIDDYQPVKIKSTENFIFNWKVGIILIKGLSKEPNVFFDIFSFDCYNLIFQSTPTFLENRVKFLVTPEEPYTIYEKLLLPFDHETWISISVTFLIAFVTVFIINLLSNNVHEIVYGRGVKTPMLNILSTFFGISLNVVPRANFARILLMILIYFSLIIRTCYQSKLFEFMTSLMRRPPPKDLDDLVKRNYTMCLHEDSLIYKEAMTDEFG